MRWLAALLLVTSASAQGPNGVVINGGDFAVAGAGGPEISDDFSTDYSSRWTEMHCAGDWSYGTGDVEFQFAWGTVGCDMQHDTALSGVTQYGLVTVADMANAVGIALRGDGTSSGSVYGVTWRIFGDYRHEFFILQNGVESSMAAVCNAGVSLPNNGDVFGVSITGTGAGITVKTYINPDTSTYPEDPSNWTAVCTWSAPSTELDTGDYVGIYHHGGQSVSGPELFDDFEASVWTP